MNLSNRLPHPHTTATRATIWCLTLGLIWIWFTDLGLWALGVSTSTTALASALKGSLFLALFGVPLYRLVRIHLINDARRARLIEAVVDATADPIFVQDATGRFIFANMAAARCLGRPTPDILNHTAAEVCGKDIADKLQELQISGTKTAHVGELELGGPDGSTYLVSVAPFDVGDGAGRVVVCHDVTESRRDRQALTASEERYRAFADHAADAFFLQREGGRIVDANAPACETLGYTRDELIGQTHAKFASLRDHDKLAPITTAVLAGESIEFEDIHRRKDGSTFPVEVRMRRVKIGPDWLVLSTARDLTQRRRADEQRVAILNALPIHVALLDRNGIVTAVNEAWRRFAASNEMASSASAVGISYLDVCDLATGDCAVEAGAAAEGLRAVLTEQVHEFRLEYPCHAPDEERWFVMIAAPVPGGGAVVMHVDVTARHQADTIARQQAEGFRLLSELAARLLSGGPWPDMLREVCDRAARFLGCDAYLGYRFNGTDLVLDLAEGFDDAARVELSRLVVGTRLCGWCAQSRETVYIPDLQSSDDPRASLARSAGLRCYLAFPLLASDRLLGTVAFASRSRDMLPKHQQEFARIVSHYLATALEQLRVRDEVREGEERWRLAVKASNIGLWDWDPRTTRVILSPQWKAQLGYEDHEIANEFYEWESRVHPDDLQPSLNRVRRTLSGISSDYTVEFRMRHKDGSWRWIYAQAELFRDENGTPIRMLGCHLDITDRRQAEQDLRESEARYRAVVDHAADAIFLMDDEYVVVDANSAACESLGYAREQLIGQTPLQFDAVISAEKLKQLFSRTFSGETMTFETEHRRLDGTTFPVEIRSRALTLSNRIYCLSVVRDLTERKRAEVNRARLAAIVESSDDAMVSKSTDGIIRTWNAGAERLFGYTRSEAIGQPITMLIPPDRLNEEVSILDRLTRGEHVQHYETVRVTRDGRHVDVSLTVSPLRDPEGRVIGASKVARDITDRKKAEAALRASEKRYRKLIELLPVGVFVQRANQVTFCNPAYARIIGASDPLAVLGRDTLEAVHPESRPDVLARIAEMKITRQAATPLELRARRFDGTYYTAYTVAMPLDGDEPDILVVVVDVSERDRADRLMRSLLDSVADAVLTIDALGTIWLANPATERLFGYTHTELVGSNVKKLMPEPYRGKHDGYITDYLRTGHGNVIGAGREAMGLRKDGNTFPVEITVTELRLGEERHFTGVIRDATARKKLEEQFRQAQKMEAIGRLAGGVAHDFNNLLTVINGYADLILQGLPSEHPQRAAASAVRDAGDRAAALTSQLLAFSRKTIVSPKVFDLRDLVTQSEKLLRRLIGEDIVLTVVSHPGPSWTHADPAQIDQVIMNLAVNARDAMPTGGQLTLETRPITITEGENGSGPNPGKYIELSVSDTGCGMTDEVRAKIFEPFFTTKELGKGTGLGLATVHGIVHQAGGQISVTSRVGVGTTFRVLIPAGAAPVLRRSSDSAMIAGRGTETILLVEDDDAVRALCALALETQGYKVRAVPSGRRALELLQQNPAETRIMVTDVVMPEMSGRELADEAVKIVPGLKVLFVSGYTDDSVLRHGVRQATDQFLQKPFSPLTLARKIRELLDTGSRPD